MELSIIVLAHAPDGRAALMAISWRQGHCGTRYALGLALLISVFVVYMNTATVMNQPPVQITNSWHIRLMEFHQKVGLIYFALMALMPVLGVSLLLAVRRRRRTAATLRAAHKRAGYAAGISWLASNIASEIGSRIPRV